MLKVGAFILSFFWIVLYSCNSNKVNETEPPLSSDKPGEELAKNDLEIGILNPSELAQGRLMARKRVLIDKMHRPVNFILADINNDNFDDFVVANFENLTWILAWYDGKTFKEKDLQDLEWNPEFYKIN